MFLPISQKFRIRSRAMRVNFVKTFTEALAPRLHPHTSLHPDVLADAIGCEGPTIRYWLRGEGAPSGPMLAAVIQFFYATGDEQFIAEVMPGVTPLIQRNKRANEALVLVENLAKFAPKEAVA